jgi:hypothetical protein
MRRRGVKKVINSDVFQYELEQFDTIIMMMNGIGLCGDMEGLKRFLEYLKKLLVSGGQIIFDSSDIAYLYKDDDFISLIITVKYPINMNINLLKGIGLSGFMSILKA